MVSFECNFNYCEELFGEVAGIMNRKCIQLNISLFDELKNCSFLLVNSEYNCSNLQYPKQHKRR